MITIIANGEVYAPEPMGRRDILVIGREVALLGDARDWPFPPGVPTRILDAAGALVLPGFVDGHVHIAGGGGEGGFRTRTPEIVLSSLVRAGVTTVIGCLGTDSITRTPAGPATPRPRPWRRRASPPTSHRRLPGAHPPPSPATSCRTCCSSTRWWGSGRSPCPTTGRPSPP